MPPSVIGAIASGFVSFDPVSVFPCGALPAIPCPLVSVAVPIIVDDGQSWTEVKIPDSIGWRPSRQPIGWGRS